VIRDIRMVHVIVLLLTAAVAVSSPSCQPAGESNSKAVASVKDPSEIELIPLYVAARQLRETGIINLASPLSGYYLQRGWSYPYSLEENGPAITAATAQEAVMRYSVLRPAERWLAFNAKPKGKYGGPNFQNVDVFAGGTKLGSFEMSGEEDLPQMIHIPAEAQQIGDNDLTFRFSVLVNNNNFLVNRKRHDEFPYPGVAGYFSEFRIYLGDQIGPNRGEVRDETGIFSLVANGRYLNQIPNSALVYAFEIGTGTTLTLSGSLRAERGATDTITVALSGRGQGETADGLELWKRELNSGSRENDIEATVPLDKVAGGIAELRLDVTSSARFSPCSVVWKRIRLDLPKDHHPAADGAREPVRVGGNVRNVVFIILDAARYDHFGCYGDNQGMTPVIDEFAKEALLFKDASSAAPYTICSISTLFSGLYPEAHGVRKITNKFPEDLESMPRAFKRSGFFTIALTGTKFVSREYGTAQDCDEVVDLRDEADKERSLSTMSLAGMEKGVKLAAESGKPVFLYCHFLPPHWPYHPPGEFNRRYVDNPKLKYWRSWQIKGLLDNGLVKEAEPDIETHHKRYMNNLHYADYATGQLFDLLKKNGLYDNSLIVITADHGEAFNEHGHFGHNTTVYDDMIKVPMIVRMPGVKPGVVEQHVNLIDFFPTFAELFNLKVENANFEGRSIAPLMMGGEMKPGDYYYSRAAGNNLIFGMRGERYKYIFFDYRELLYDLVSDPGEKVNIIDQNKALASFLRQRALLSIAANAALRGDEGLDVELSPEDEKELRNLGYVH
jgi:arylsulfatase A-like enzyme